MANLLIVDGLECRLHDDVDPYKLHKEIKANMTSDDGKVLEIKLAIDGEVLLLNCNSRLPYAYIGVPDEQPEADGPTSMIAEAGTSMPSMRRI